MLLWISEWINEWMNMSEWVSVWLNGKREISRVKSCDVKGHGARIIMTPIQCLDNVPWKNEEAPTNSF